MSVVRQLLRHTLTACLPTRYWLVQGSSHRSHGISLTFDDGPHPVHTPRVLEALAHWQQTGTFFVIGRLARRYPELIQQIVDAGHQLANHTWSHSEPATTSASTFLAEVEQTQELLDEYGRRPVHWMRPPKGELTPRKLLGLLRRKQSIALWNVDPRDYRMTLPRDMEDWCAQYTPTHGDIVLLHDCHRWAADIIETFGRAGVYQEFPSVGLDAWVTILKPNRDYKQNREPPSLSMTSRLQFRDE